MLRKLVLLFLVAEGLCYFYNKIPIVCSPAGKFRGKILEAPNGRRYNSFRGIPYVQPPVGDLRFAKPQPLPRIQGTFDATEYGEICVQPEGRPDRGQEDCLSLNVFTPLTFRRPFKLRISARRNLKPVMVVIHGGGGILGSSQDYGLPGDLVTKGRIVVVTVNYRLGWFGFLRGNTDELPGNQALLDIILSLEWVKDNIRSFGGDPDDVTLFGQSAGASFVAGLSISPLTKGLYQKAILLSTSAIFLPYPPRSSNDLLTIAANQFCGNTGDAVDVDSATECLKNVPAQDLDIDIQLQNILPSSQDEVFPGSIPDLLADQNYLTNVGFFSRNYLLSSTKDDGIVVINSDLFRPDISTPALANTFVANLLGLDVAAAEAPLEPYRNLNPGNDEKALTGFFTDFIIQQDIDFLEVFNSAPPAEVEGEAFLMSFDYEPSYVRDMLVLHGLDLVYLFDLSPQGLLDLYYSTFTVQGFFTKQDRRVKRSFIRLISDFVKTGNPGKRLKLPSANGAEWDPYDPEEKNYLSFSERSTLEEDLLGRRFAA